MPLPLEAQLAAAEHALEGSTNAVIRGALQSQILGIKKKLTSKEKRTTTLPDGTVVKVGDQVFWASRDQAFRSVSRPRYKGDDKQVLPTIKQSQIAGINATGEIALKEGGFTSQYWNGRMNYNSVRSYRGSAAAAAKGALDDCWRTLTDLLETLAAATANADMASEDISNVEAWAVANGVELSLPAEAADVE